MRWLLGVFAILVFLGGLFVLVTTQNIWHQIFAAVILCWSGVLFVGAAILTALGSIEKQLIRLSDWQRTLGSGKM